MSQTAPQASISVDDSDTTANTITFKHGGGQDLVSGDFRLVIDKEGGSSFTMAGSGSTELSTANTFTVTTTSTGEAVSNWGTWTEETSDAGFDLISGDTVTVTFVHEPSGQIVAEKTVQV